MAWSKVPNVEINILQKYNPRRLLKVVNVDMMISRTLKQAKANKAAMTIAIVRDTVIGPVSPAMVVLNCPASGCKGQKEMRTMSYDVKSEELGLWVVFLE